MSNATEQLNILLKQKKELENQLEVLNERIHNELPPLFEVEENGRTLTLIRNSYKNTIKYPKVNPKTGKRVYDKNAFWYNENGRYIILYTYDDFKNDVEWITEHGNDENHNHIYDTEKGFTRPGYEWDDISSEYSPTYYVEKKIEKEPKTIIGKKRKNR